MRVLFYSTKEMEKPLLAKANGRRHEIHFSTESLTMETAGMSRGFDCVSVFTGDDVSGQVMRILNDVGVKYIAVRAAGYDNVDLTAAAGFGIKVGNVPCYSPFAVAEHAVALIQALNRKIIKGYENSKVRNFLVDDLVGFDLNKKTVGIIGTGRIGSVFARIMHGFGCKLLGYDILEDESLVKNYGLSYVNLDQLYSRSDIISLHTPLNQQTAYMLSIQAFNKMKTGVMVINTARGGLVKTTDLLYALEKGKVGYYGADVYEKERGLFFHDLSDRELTDPIFSRLIAFDNVLITPHQGFATNEALFNIASTTFVNIDLWSDGRLSGNELSAMQKVNDKRHSVTSSL